MSTHLQISRSGTEQRMRSTAMRHLAGRGDHPSLYQIYRRLGDHLVTKGGPGRDNRRPVLHSEALVLLVAEYHVDREPTSRRDGVVWHEHTQDLIESSKTLA